MESAKSHAQEKVKRPDLNPQKALLISRLKTSGGKGRTLKKQLCPFVRRKRRSRRKRRRGREGEWTQEEISPPQCLFLNSSIHDPLVTLSVNEGFTLKNTIVTNTHGPRALENWVKTDAGQSTF